MTNLSEENISLATLLILGVILLAFFLVLVSLIYILLKKLREKSRPTFGFGGKTLYTFIIISCAVFSIFLSMNVVVKTSDYVKIARQEKNVYLDIREYAQEDGSYSVILMAIPEVNGEIWPQGSYDIYWKISNGEELEYVEYERNATDFSFLSLKLGKGDYQVTVLIEGENFLQGKEEVLKLE